MKFLVHLRAYCLSAILAFAAVVPSVQPAQAQIGSLTLLNNASTSGGSFRPSPGGHLLSISGTFGGATVALVETQILGGGQTTLGSWTSVPSSQPCIVVPSDVTIQMTVTGGSPSGLYAILGGTGGNGCVVGSSSGGGTGDASASNQSTQITAEQAIQSTLGAKTDAKNAASDTTSLSLTSILKQISFSIQAVLSALSSGITVATHAVTQSGSWVLSAGSAIIGKVGIDQTTPGTTNHVDAGVSDGGSVTIGAKADSACGTDAGTCTLQGLVKRLLGSITTLNGKIDTLNGNVTSAVPTQSAANIIGGVGTVLLNGVLTTPRMCSLHAYKHITTATDTQIVAASGSTTIYVCGYSISSNGTGNIYLEKATTGTCATLTQIDQAWYTIANWAKIIGTDFYHGLNTGASAQLCAHTDQAVSIDIGVDYDQN